MACLRTAWRNEVSAAAGGLRASSLTGLRARLLIGLGTTVLGMALRATGLVVIAVLLVLVGPRTSGAQQIETPEARHLPPSGRVPRITLLVNSSSDPLYAAMEEGARRALADRHFLLRVESVGAESAVIQQIDLVRRLVRSGETDGIVIVPTDSVRLLPILAQAVSQGVAVVTLSTPLRPTSGLDPQRLGIAHVGIDDAAAAARLATAVADRALGANDAGAVLVLDGSRAADVTLARHRGVFQALQGDPRITGFVSREANGEIERAYAQTQEVLSLNNGVRMIIATSGLMGLGASQYCHDQETCEVVIGAFDATEPVRRALEEGRLAVIVDQRPDDQAYIAVNTVLDMVSDKEVAPRTLLEPYLIDQSSLSERP